MKAKIYKYFENAKRFKEPKEILHANKITINEHKMAFAGDDKDQIIATLDHVFNVIIGNEGIRILGAEMPYPSNRWIWHIQEWWCELQ